MENGDLKKTWLHGTLSSHICNLCRHDVTLQGFIRSLHFIFLSLLNTKTRRPCMCMQGSSDVYTKSQHLFPIRILLAALPTVRGNIATAENASCWCLQHTVDTINPVTRVHFLIWACSTFLLFFWEIPYSVFFTSTSPPSVVNVCILY